MARLDLVIHRDLAAYIRMKPDLVIALSCSMRQPTCIAQQELQRFREIVHESLVQSRWTAMMAKANGARKAQVRSGSDGLVASGYKLDFERAWLVVQEVWNDARQSGGQLFDRVRLSVQSNVIRRGRNSNMRLIIPECFNQHLHGSACLCCKLDIYWHNRGHEATVLPLSGIGSRNPARENQVLTPRHRTPGAWRSRSSDRRATGRALAPGMARRDRAARWHRRPAGCGRAGSWRC